MDNMPKKKKAKLSKPLREKRKQIKKATRFMERAQRRGGGLQLHRPAARRLF